MDCQFQNYIATHAIVIELLANCHVCVVVFVLSKYPQVLTFKIQ